MSYWLAALGPSEENEGEAETSDKEDGIHKKQDAVEGSDPVRDKSEVE
tara:strand:+ start:76 stop:219 length:144 start_codon:yes stop_codon:yes gene_type:complete